MAVGVLAAMAGACAVPASAYSSPYFGSSAPSFPGTANQVATVTVCSQYGGPVHVAIDVDAPTPITEISVSLVQSDVHWNDGEDSTTAYTIGGPAHMEYTTIDALDVGECATVSITSMESHNTDASATRPFTFSVIW